MKGKFRLPFRLLQVGIHPEGPVAEGPLYDFDFRGWTAQNTEGFPGSQNHALNKD
jgi:hypothetical protein